ncbi:hypothetical protein GCM10028773_19740 [Spirosoma koreense]
MGQHDRRPTPAPTITRNGIGEDQRSFLANDQRQDIATLHGKGLAHNGPDTPIVHSPAPVRAPGRYANLVGATHGNGVGVEAWAGG